MMSKKQQFISRIDIVLEQYQFRRIGASWDRVFGDFIDVIDLQVSKSLDMFTINMGVAEKSILDICWGLSNYVVVDEPSCTVRARLGSLMFGRDSWWSLSDASSIEEVLHGIENVGISFLETNHSINQMIKSLEDGSPGSHYPPEAIYLALLYDRKGDRDLARDMLRNLQTRITGEWHQKVSKILDRLN